MAEATVPHCGPGSNDSNFSGYHLLVKDWERIMQINCLVVRLFSELNSNSDEDHSVKALLGTITRCMSEMSFRVTAKGIDSHIMSPTSQVVTYLETLDALTSLGNERSRGAEDDESSCIRKSVRTVLEKLANSLRVHDSNNDVLRDAIDNYRIADALVAIRGGADVNSQGQEDKFTILHVLIDTLHAHGIAGDVDPPIVLDGVSLSLLEATVCVATNPDLRLFQNVNKNTALHLLAKCTDENGRRSKLVDEPSVLSFLTELLTADRSSCELNCHNFKGVSAFMLSLLHGSPISAQLAGVVGMDVNASTGGPCKFSDYRQGLLTSEQLTLGRRMCGSVDHAFIAPVDFTPLMTCCLFNQRDVLDVLLTRSDLQTAKRIVMLHGPRTGGLCEIEPGETHLHYAVLNDDLDQLVYLLNRLGPKALTCVNDEHQTILHKACQLGRLHIIRFLLCKERLRAAFGNGNPLNDDDYRTFVNRASDTGRAASTYCLLWNAALADARVVYETFVECGEYEMSAVDNTGRSLLHIIAGGGHSGLLKTAVDTRLENNNDDIDFSRLSGGGQVPLEMAIKSHSPNSSDIIREMAALAYDGMSTICQNRIMQCQPHMRKIMSACLREKRFHPHIAGLSVEDLQYIYTHNIPKLFDAGDCYTDLEVKVYRLENGGAVARNRYRRDASLEGDVGKCLNQMYQQRACLAVDLPIIDARLNDLYHILKGIYRSVGFGTIDFRYLGVDYRAWYKLIEDPSRRKCYKVAICYEDIIKRIGSEWDYVSREEEGVDLKSDSGIFSIRHTPFLQLIIMQIEQAIAEKKGDDLEAGMKKLRAFLEFPYIEIEQFDDVVTGIKNPMLCAPNEETKQLLKQKLDSQLQIVRGCKMEEQVLNEVKMDYTLNYNVFLKEWANKNSFNRLKEGDTMRKVKENEDSSEARLYKFAELFCFRLATVLSSRKNYAVDSTSRILDSMARLLEVDSVCTAIAFLNDCFYITSNFGSATSDRIKITEHVRLAAELLFSYMALLVKKDCSDEERSNALNQILDITLPQSISFKVLRNKKLNMFYGPQIINENSKTNLRKLADFCLANINAITKRVRKDENGQTIFHKTLLMVCARCGEVYLGKTAQPFTCISKRCAKSKPLFDKYLKNSVLMPVFRFCRDLCKLRDALVSRDEKKRMPITMLQTFQRGNNCDGGNVFQVVENVEGVHAESALVSHLFCPTRPGNEATCTPQDIYIGISKICCPHCALFLQTFRDVAGGVEVPRLHTRGSHQSLYSWLFPRMLVEDVDRLAQFFGGRRSPLHAHFANLTADQKMEALNVVQNFEYKKLLEYKLEHLCQILLIGSTHIKHSQAEMSLSRLSSVDVHVDDLADELGNDIVPREEMDLLYSSIYRQNCAELSNIFRTPNWGFLVNSPHPYNGLAALHVAAHCGDLNLAERLIELGAQRFVIDKLNRTPEDHLLLDADPSAERAAIWDLLYPERATIRKELEQTRMAYLVAYEDIKDEDIDRYGFYAFRTDFTHPSVRENLCLLVKAIKCLILNLLQEKIRSHRMRDGPFAPVFSGIDVTFSTICKLSSYVAQQMDKGDFSGMPARFLKVLTTRLAHLRLQKKSFVNLVQSSLSREVLHQCLQAMLSSGELECLGNTLSGMLTDEGELPASVQNPAPPAQLMAFLDYLMDVYNCRYIRRALWTSFDGDSAEKRKARLLNCCMLIGEAVQFASPHFCRTMEDSDREDVIGQALAILSVILGVADRPECAASIRRYLCGESEGLQVDGLLVDTSLVIECWSNEQFIQLLNSYEHQLNSSSSDEIWTMIENRTGDYKTWDFDKPKAVVESGKARPSPVTSNLPFDPSAAILQHIDDMQTYLRQEMEYCGEKSNAIWADWAHRPAEVEDDRHHIMHPLFELYPLLIGRLSRQLLKGLRLKLLPFFSRLLNNTENDRIKTPKHVGLAYGVIWEDSKSSEYLVSQEYFTFENDMIVGLEIIKCVLTNNMDSYGEATDKLKTLILEASEHFFHQLRVMF